MTPTRYVWKDTDGNPVVAFGNTRLTHRRHGRHTVITAHGWLTWWEAFTFRDELTPPIHDGDGDVIVDLTDLDFSTRRHSASSSPRTDD